MIMIIVQFSLLTLKVSTNITFSLAQLISAEAELIIIALSSDSNVSVVLIRTSILASCSSTYRSILIGNGIERVLSFGNALASERRSTSSEGIEREVMEEP